MTTIQAIISHNYAVQPSGSELAGIPYGMSLDDLKGKLHRKVSFWAIDESGNPGHTIGAQGKFVTYSAVTQLSKVDYEELFQDIPLEEGTDGNKRIHWMHLRKNHPGDLEKVIDRVSKSAFLALSLPIKKEGVNKLPRGISPRNAIYVAEYLSKLVTAIEYVDTSPTIIVNFDKTDDITAEIVQLIWTDRTTVLMDKSHLKKLLDTTDLIVSSVGNAINYPNDINNDLFWKLKSINVNIAERGATNLDVNPDTTLRSRVLDYLKTSREKVKQGKNKRI